MCILAWTRAPCAGRGSWDDSRQTPAVEKPWRPGVCVCVLHRLDGVCDSADDQRFRFALHARKPKGKLKRSPKPQCESWWRVTLLVFFLGLCFYPANYFINKKTPDIFLCILKSCHVDMSLIHFSLRAWAKVPRKVKLPLITSFYTRDTHTTNTPDSFFPHTSSSDLWHTHTHTFINL